MLEKTLSSIVSISGIKKIDEFSDLQSTLLDIMNNLNNKENKNENIIEKIGSGIIIDGKSGYIITNAHVVSNLDIINVMLKDNRISKAKLVGATTYYQSQEAEHRVVSSVQATADTRDPIERLNHTHQSNFGCFKMLGCALIYARKTVYS